MIGLVLRNLSASGLLAFGFANPWLLCGLALGAIPIVIHLLSRRAYRETDWAAMRFLLEAARKELPPDASRAAHSARGANAHPSAGSSCVCRAAGGGRLTAGSAADALAPTDRDRRVVQYGRPRMEPGTRFDRAKSVARQIVADSQPGDAVSILRIVSHTSPNVIREPAFEQDVVLPEIDRLQLTDEPGELRCACRGCRGSGRLASSADERSDLSERLSASHVGRRHFGEIGRGGPVPQDRRQGQDRADRRRGRADG